MKNCCPTLIAVFGNKARNKIEPIDICGKFIIRNPNPEEIEFLNKHRNDGTPSPFRILLYQILPSHYFIAVPMDKHINRDELEQDASGITKRVLTLLRLNNRGGLSLILVWIKIPGHPDYVRDTSRIFGDTVWEGYSKPYDLDHSGLESLVDEFWDKEIETDSIVRWFNKSFAEIYLEDKLTDLVFALEQIYVKGEGENLSYKFALRCAFYLAENDEEKWRIFTNARDAYRERSKIVHSGKVLKNEQKNVELLVDLEDYLRRSIPRYLRKEEPFNLKGGKMTEFWDKRIIFKRGLGSVLSGQERSQP